MTDHRLPEVMNARAYTTEEMFLGALIVAAEWAAEECPTLWGLEVSDFWTERWATVFEAIAGLFRAGVRPTYINLCHALRDADKLAFVGGASEITRLISISGSFVTLPSLADSILELSERRAILEASSHAAQLAFADGDASEAVEEAKRILGQAQQRRLARLDQAVLYHEDAQELVYQEMLGREARAENEMMLIETPWEDMNRYVGCFRPGHLFVLAGYPAHGKTVMFEQIAEHNACCGFQVVFFHLEHTNWWMTARRTMRLTGAHLYAQEQGRCMEETLNAGQEVHDWAGGIHYVHCPGWSAMQIAQKMRELHDAGRCDLAIVDYLQKITLADRRGWNKASLIGDTVEALKTAGEELRIPVLLGSQLSRAGHDRPHLNHLRDSGEIEEKANYVAFVYRERLINNSLSQSTQWYQEKPFDGQVTFYFDSTRLAFVQTTKEELNYD